MNKIKTLMTPVALLLLATSGASYATQATLTVKGSITPPACTPSFSNGGNVDYGVIIRSQLKENDTTALPTSEITFSINCSAPAKVGFTATDNRFGTNTNTNRYGLGLDRSGNKIGQFRILSDAESATVNGNNSTLLQTLDGSSTSRTASIMPYSHNSQTVLWASDRSGSNTTLATVPNVTTASVVLGITPEINPTSKLDLANDVNLDGNVTFTVVYL